MRLFPFSQRACSSPGRLRGADTTFALTWRSSSQSPCVTEAALQTARSHEGSDARRFAERERAEIIIEERSAIDGERWKARIVQRDRGGVLFGEREITAKSCASLIRAATVVVACLSTRATADQAAPTEAEAPTQRVSELAAPDDAAQPPETQRRLGFGSPPRARAVRNHMSRPHLS